MCYVTGKDGRVRVISQATGASALLSAAESAQNVVDLAIAGTLSPRLHAHLHLVAMQI